MKDNVERIDCKDFTCERFVEEYEKPYKPVVITGVTDSWKGRYKWTLEVGFYD